MSEGLEVEGARREGLASVAVGLLAPSLLVGLGSDEEPEDSAAVAVGLLASSLLVGLGSDAPSDPGDSAAVSVGLLEEPGLDD